MVTDWQWLSVTRGWGCGGRFLCPQSWLCSLHYAAWTHAKPYLVPRSAAQHEGLHTRPELGSRGQSTDTAPATDPQCLSQVAPTPDTPCDASDFSVPLAESQDVNIKRDFKGPCTTSIQK